MEGRQLVWPMCRNVRDLGGLAIGPDHQVRAHALVRSDNLDQLDETGIAAVRSAGVSRIIDLRSVWQCQTFPSPFANDPIWVNVWLNDPGEPDESRLPLAQQYYNALDRQQDQVAAAIAAIADAPPGCVVVTCHTGKDRTGVVIALALGPVTAVPRRGMSRSAAGCALRPVPHRSRREPAPGPQVSRSNRVRAQHRQVLRPTGVPISPPFDRARTDGSSHPE